MFCPKCGKENPENSVNCLHCGGSLDFSQAKPRVEVTSAVDGLIPHKNSYGLIAYYLGVFSVIPCLGLILGIPAFFFGLKGLKVYKENPERKGKVHSLIGVWLGGICGSINLIAMIVLIILAIGSSNY